MLWSMALILILISVLYKNWVINHMVPQMHFESLHLIKKSSKHDSPPPLAKVQFMNL